jgi:hypothetical protein
MSETNGTAALSEREVQLVNTLELLEERIAELEGGALLFPEDAGWSRLGSAGRQDFSRDFLARLIARSRLYALHNPLVRRGVSLQSIYVFGQGMNIQAAHPDVNDVVQAFLDDVSNKAELTAHTTRTETERTLQTDGNLFFALFTNPLTGRVQVRTIDVDEVADVVTNPDDAREAWYYKRAWSQTSLDPSSGAPRIESRTAFYPDWRHRPARRPDSIGGFPVEWATPVYHVKVGGLKGMKFGVPETYAALDWAQAYKKFLENWATITSALARFAWKATTAGGARGVAATKAKLGSTVSPGSGEANPPPVAGSTFIAAAGSGADLTPIRTAGATTSAEDGRQLRLMVAAALGLPDTFFGDADQGTLATAKSLDRPTELKFRDRQTLWSDVYQDLLQYVIDQAVTAPRGPLQGTVTQDDEGRRVVTLADDPTTGEPMDRTVAIAFPPILEHSADDTIGALVSGVTLDGKKLLLDTPEMVELVLKQVLGALGIEDVDEVLDRLLPKDDDGNLLPIEKPEPPIPPVVLPDPPAADQPPAVEARAREIGALLEAGLPLESALVWTGSTPEEAREVVEAKLRQIERDQVLAREDRIPEVQP